jgi:hypothetical protein
MKILVCDGNKVVPVRKRPRLKHSMRMGSGISSPAIQFIIIPIYSQLYVEYRVSIFTFILGHKYLLCRNTVVLTIGNVVKILYRNLQEFGIIVLNKIEYN